MDPMNTLKNSVLETPSAVTLAYAEQGDPAASALLLLHGYSDSWRAYGPLLGRLARVHRTIAVSLRGHADSPRPETGYGIGDFASDLLALMDRCGLPNATVVGHSMGSMVAARLALDHPDRVEALVLIGALATLKGNAAAEGELRDAVEDLTDPVPADFVRAFQESTLARPVAPAFLETVIAESLKMPARVWRAALRSMLEQDLSPELHRIGVPALILWGDHDGLCDRASQTALARAIPDARLSVLAGAGHAPHWEDPAGVAAEIACFVASTAPAADGPGADP